MKRWVPTVVPVNSTAVSNAARLIHRSPSRFRHLLKELTGETYQQTRLQIKLSYGAFLLRTTNLTIQEISFMLGYSERCEFDKPFKRAYGTTPLNIAINKTEQTK